jgi:hypothetical protein
MSSEPKHAGTLADKKPKSPRHKALDELAKEIRRTFDFETDLDLREDRPVLSVYDVESQRSTEVSCDLSPPGWRFTWVGGEHDGRTIAPAEEYAGMACYLARFLRTAPEDLS